jgi:hypothetical protein
VVRLEVAPRVFGDRVQTEVTGADGGPVPLTLSRFDWDALLKRVTSGTMEDERGSRRSLLSLLTSLQRVRPRIF